VRKAKPTPEPVAATPVTFDKYIDACRDIVAEFRDALSDETAQMRQDRGANPHEFDVQHFAYLHRIGLACDAFLSTLSGNY
jgi:hypothetical protein